MKTKLLALLLLTTLNANAIVIEDSTERFEFEVFWEPQSPFGGGVNLTLGPGYVREPFSQWSRDAGNPGSGIDFHNASMNQYRYEFAIQRVIDDVFQPETWFQLVFRTTLDQWDTFHLVGDPMFGSNVFIGVAAFPIADRPYAARLVMGLPHPVPEGEDSLIILVFAGALIIGMMIGRTYGH